MEEDEVYEPKWPFTEDDVEQMQQYVEDYCFDELLCADVRWCPEEFIDSFMTGKAIGNSLTEEEWEEYISCKTDETNQAFLLPRFCKLNNIPQPNGDLSHYDRFVTDMGVTAVAYEKGIFPINDEDDDEYYDDEEE